MKRVGFDDVLLAMKHPQMYLLISTLPKLEQQCLIPHTVPVGEEEPIMNRLMTLDLHGKKPVILYGKNCADISVEQKYHQLTTLGFREVHVYGGGMLEWTLLQDIFGTSEFPTTSVVTDLLRFQPQRRLLLSN